MFHERALTTFTNNFGVFSVGSNARLGGCIVRVASLRSIPGGVAVDVVVVDRLNAAHRLTSWTDAACNLRPSES